MSSYLRCNDNAHNLKTRHFLNYSDMIRAVFTSEYKSVLGVRGDISFDFINSSLYWWSKIVSIFAK